MEDLILIRKNVSLEQLFNTAFIVYIVGFFFSRLVYVLLHFNSLYLNPIVFLAIFRFYGLNLIGGLIGGSLYLYYLSKLKKLPSGRIFDFLSLATLSAFPYAYFGMMLIEKKDQWLLLGIAGAFYLLLFILFLKLLYPRSMRGDLKDGSIGMLFILNVSVVTLLLHLPSQMKHGVIQIKPDDVVTFALFLVFLVLLLRLQMIKQGRRKSD